MNSVKHILAALVAVSGLGLLHGCGGGGGAGGTTNDPNPIATVGEVVALKDYMQDYYLWYKELGNPDLTGVTTAKEALEKLKVLPKDRYSYIDTAANYNAFFREGKAIGAGFGMVERSEKVFISFVRPGSPAEAAGLKRADRILKANGVTATTIKSLDDAIGAREVGIRLILDIERAGTNLSIDMTKAEYDILTVTNSNLLTVNGRKVGYLYFYAFIARTTADWNTAIAALRAQGAQDLIVDLRHNGGGYLNTAGELAGTLKATQPAASDVLTQLRFNDRHSNENSPTRIGRADLGSRFDKLIFLTTEGSCSASEALMNGLAAFQRVISIGTKTCGKPVGFTPRTVGTQVFSIVTFDMANSAGTADYYDGLPPTCLVEDTFTGQFGTSSEPLMATALSYLASGTCPVSANAAGAEKSVSGSGKTVYGRTADVAGQFGLY
jgi:carboxyl-terminal processing protease